MTVCLISWLRLKCMTIFSELRDLSTLSNLAPFWDIKLKPKTKTFFKVATISLQGSTRIVSVGLLDEPNFLQYPFIIIGNTLLLFLVRGSNYFFIFLGKQINIWNATGGNITSRIWFLWNEYTLPCTFYISVFKYTIPILSHILSIKWQ